MKAVAGLLLLAGSATPLMAQEPIEACVGVPSGVVRGESGRHPEWLTDVPLAALASIAEQ